MEDKENELTFREAMQLGLSKGMAKGVNLGEDIGYYEKWLKLKLGVKKWWQKTIPSINTRSSKE